MKEEVRFSLGYMKPRPTWPFGGIGYAYVTNRMRTTLTRDPRDVALREALYAAGQV